MAKKLTKAQIAKNPTKAINSGKMKMKKQEVPLSGIGKAAAKAVGKVLGKKTAAKGSSRQAGDYVVSGSSAKRTMPKVYANREKGKDFAIGENVKIKNTVSPSGRVFVRGGATQVVRENLRSTKPLTKAEAKANARGLKAARGKLSKGNAKREYNKDKIEMIMKYNPGDSKADAIRWSSHPGHASQKSNARLQKGKWSSEKQIARYQKSEIKDFRKPQKKSK